jgi:hypothetical protein
MARQFRFLKIVCSVSLSFLLAFSIFFAGAGQVYADDVFIPNDIAGHWAESEIMKALELGYINGYPDGSFKPNNFVTKAEFAVMIDNAVSSAPFPEKRPYIKHDKLVMDSYDPADPTIRYDPWRQSGRPTLPMLNDIPAGFFDVSETDWFYLGLTNAFRNGIIGEHPVIMDESWFARGGYDDAAKERYYTWRGGGYFNADEKILRHYVVRSIDKTLSKARIVSQSDPNPDYVIDLSGYTKYADGAIENLDVVDELLWQEVIYFGIMSGDTNNNLRATSEITRAEVVKVLNNLLRVLETEEPKYAI